MPAFHFRAPLPLGLGLAALLAAACASSSSSSGGDDGKGGPGGGGGTSADGGDAKPTTHPLCGGGTGGGPTLPASFGKSCAMGSNQALCAKSGSSDCAGGACLWDANAVGTSRAYCTIECDPSSASSCPTDFACKAQGCPSSGPPNVCVRVTAATQPQRSCSDISPGRPAIIRDVFQARDGRLYTYVGLSTPSAVAIFTRAPSETAWTSIWERPGTSVQPEGERLATNDAVYFTVGAGLLLRITGTQVAEERYETCASGGCSMRIDALWTTTKGAVRAASSFGAPILERDASGKWTPVVQKAPRRFVPIAVFPKGGFYAICDDGSTDPQARIDKSCVGDAGDDLVDLVLPDGGKVVSTTQKQEVLPVLGDALDDFWVFSEKGTLYRRIGTSLEKEGLPDADGLVGGLLVRLGDGTLYAKRAKDAFKLDATCWRSVSPSIEMGIPTSGKRVGFPTDRQFCESELP